MTLPVQLWCRNAHAVPVIQEIRESMKKVPKACGEFLLPLEIRGKIMWFQKKPQAVVLALHHGQEVDEMQRFMRELKKDLDMILQEIHENAAGWAERSSSSERAKKNLSLVYHTIVEQSLLILRDHPKCLSASYLPSRMTLVAKRDPDKGIVQVRVMGLSHRKVAIGEPEEMNKPAEDIKRQFCFAVCACVELLEAPRDEPHPPSFSAGEGPGQEGPAQGAPGPGA